MYFIADDSRRPKPMSIIPPFMELLNWLQWSIFDMGEDPNNYAYYCGDKGFIHVVKVKFETETQTLEIDQNDSLKNMRHIKITSKKYSYREIFDYEMKGKDEWKSSVLPFNNAEILGKGCSKGNGES